MEAPGVTTGDAHFRQDFLDGERAVMKVIHLIHSRGVDLFLPGRHLVPEGESHEGWGDDGDLFIDKHGRRYRIEVKWIPACGDFTSIETCLNGDRLIIEEAPRYDAKHPKPHAYVMVNKSMTGMIWIDVAETRHRWFTQTDYFPRDNREKTCYRLALSHEGCRYHSLETSS